MIELRPDNLEVVLQCLYDAKREQAEMDLPEFTYTFLCVDDNERLLLEGMLMGYCVRKYGWELTGKKYDVAPGQRRQSTFTFGELGFRITLVTAKL